MNDALEELAPTGHDLHFLSRLDRVEMSQAELALRLYRSPDVVRALFTDAACPPDADRLAVPIREGDAPPHVIIARSGAFVTCLGSHMALNGLPVVGWDRLRVHLRRDDLRRAQLARADEVLEESDTTALITRVFSAGPGLTREEFTALAALEPLLHPLYLRELASTFTHIVECGALIARIRQPVKPAQERLLRVYWGSFHALGHLSLLLGVGGATAFEHWAEALGEDVRPFRVYLYVAQYGHLPNALRAFWTLGRAGKRALPVLKEGIDSAENMLQWLAPAAALASVASRHRRTRAEAFGLINFSRLPETARLAMTKEMADWIREVKGFLTERVEQIADDLPGLEHQIDQLAAHMSGRPIEELSPDRLATAWLASQPIDYCKSSEGIGAAFEISTLLCRVPPEQFYFPASLIAQAPKYSPAAALALPSLYRAPRPAKAQPRPGRNEPCHCGSGKKYKRCCG